MMMAIAVYATRTEKRYDNESRWDNSCEEGVYARIVFNVGTYDHL